MGKTSSFLIFCWLLILPLHGTSQGLEEMLFALDANTSQIVPVDLQSSDAGTPFATPILCEPDGACGMAFTGYSLFYVDATDPARRIYEINPQDGTLWNVLSSPAEFVDGLAYEDGSLYALSFEEDRIYRLDAFDGTVLGTVDVHADLIGGLGMSGGRLFASRIDPPQLFELDPTSGQILNQFTGPSVLPSGLAALMAALFISDPLDQVLYRLDIDTGATQRVFTLPLTGIAALAAGEGFTEVPYILQLELVAEEPREDQTVDFELTLALVHTSRGVLETNGLSAVTFAITEGPGEFLTSSTVVLEAGRASVGVRVPNGQFARVVALLPGLETAVALLQAQVPTEGAQLSLQPSGEGDRLVDVSMGLFDSFGQPVELDTGAVFFEVLSGSGVLVGPALVPIERGVAHTTVELIQGHTELVVAAQADTLREIATLSVSARIDEPKPESGGLVVSARRIASRDNLPPAPPTDLRVLVADGQVELRWTLSAEDGTSGAGFIPFNDRIIRRGAPVSGYRIYRNKDEDLFAEIGRVVAGIDRFLYVVPTEEGVYRYKVLATDRDNASEISISTGSEADLRRIVNIGGGVARDEEGAPVLGVFGEDLVISFDDFFLFADHFGFAGEDEGFDAIFDLDGNGAVGFQDFFIFAGNFGRRAVAVY